MTNKRIRHTESLGLPSGRYSLPKTSEPTHLVVMFHGYGNNSCSWRDHLRRVAARGAVAVAMDYSKQDLETNRGWRVMEGAVDSIRAARHFLQRYPSIETVIAFGVSMGGNASGMAVAHPDAVRHDGERLFDHWIAAEGLHDLLSHYLVYRNASEEYREDVEAEAGGSFEENPEPYLELTNLARVEDMAYLKTAILLHGVDDLLVPVDHSRRMAAALRGVGVPTELFTFVGRGDGESGTTITALAGDAIFDAAGLGPYESPMAGHAWEGSDSHILMRTAFEQLWRVMDAQTVGPYREVVVHGEGLRVPVP